MRSVCQHGCPSASACQGACTRSPAAVHPVLRFARTIFDIAFVAFGIGVIAKLAVAAIFPGAF